MRPLELAAVQACADRHLFGQKATLAREITALKDAQLGAYIAERLRECTDILSPAGKLKASSVPGVQGGLRSLEWNHVLKHALGEPPFIRNPVLSLLFYACQQAERDFALDVCPAHSHESVLTGRFVEGIKGACTAWATAAASYLDRVQNTLELSSIDLAVGGLEQETGGDFALILDIEHPPGPPDDADGKADAPTGAPRGHLFVPLIFQAKCYHGLSADISRKNPVRGYQFNALRKTTCASNYLFYENAKGGIEHPCLPMVKPSAVCVLPGGVPTSTAVHGQSMNFSTYVLRAANGFPDIPAAPSREDALNMILANISSTTVTRVAILGNTEGLEQAYRNALVQLEREMAPQAGQGLGPDDDPPGPSRGMGP